MIVDIYIWQSMSDLNVDEVEADYIILTHSHGDHIGDTVNIAKERC